MIDIRYGQQGLAGVLSNISPREFVFDGVPCRSIESVLQSFKFRHQSLQKRMCAFPGWEAKQRGLEANLLWQPEQKLWWKGEEYDRGSEAYWNLLKRLFICVYSSCESYRNELLSSGNELFTHSIGQLSQKETVLTQSEFCFLLMLTRDEIRSAQLME